MPYSCGPVGEAGDIHLTIDGDDFPPEWPDISAFVQKYGRIDCLHLENGNTDAITVWPKGVKEIVILNYPNLQRIAELPIDTEYLVIQDTPLLTELPALPTLQKLEIYKTGITALPKLNPQLKKLSIAKSNLLDFELPAHLQELYLISLSITRLPTLPESLQETFIKACSLLNFAGEWPDGLKGLDIRFCNNVAYPAKLPKCLRLLKYMNSGPAFVNELPEGIQTVYISDCHQVPIWPSTLQSLCLWRCPVIQDVNITSLPTTLEHLLLDNCPQITRIDNLPLGLQSLDIDDLPMLNEAVDLPPNLINLGIRDCTLTALALPPNLSGLILSCVNLPQLPKLPSSLVNLNINSCSITGQLWLPDTLRKLHLNFTQLYPVKIPCVLEYAIIRGLNCTELPNFGRARKLQEIYITGCKYLQRLPALPAELFAFATKPQSGIIGYIEISNCPLLPNFTPEEFQRLQELRHRINLGRLRRLFYAGFLRWRAKQWAGVHTDIECRPGRGVEWINMQKSVYKLTGMDISD